MIWSLLLLLPMLAMGTAFGQSMKPTDGEAMDQPQPGDVYTIENIQEAYDYLPKFFPNLLQTWDGENEKLKIPVESTTDIEYPQSYIDLTRKHYKDVQLNPDGSIENYVTGMPFPTERMIGKEYDRFDPDDKGAGWKVVYNWFMRPLPNTTTAKYMVALVDRHQNIKYQGFLTILLKPSHRTQKGPIDPNPNSDKYAVKWMPIVNFPSSAKDIAQLNLTPDNTNPKYFNASSQIYAYLPSLRRVVPMSGAGAAHCAPTGGTDWYVDDNNGLNINLGMFNAEYVRQDKMLIPFGTQRQYLRKRPQRYYFENFTQAGIPRQTRWELRDVHVVEITPKSEYPEYCYPVRRVYFDAETYFPIWWETVDKNMKPWKIGMNSQRASKWRPDLPQNDDKFYDQNAYPTVWDLQAQHASISSVYPGDVKSTDKYSSSDLTPGGLLKVVK